MNTLELTFKVNKLSILYKKSSKTWNEQDCIFKVTGRQVGLLKLNEKVYDIEELESAWSSLEDKAKSFELAMKLSGNFNVELKFKKPGKLIFNKQNYAIRDFGEIKYIVKLIKGEITSYCYGILPMMTGKGKITVEPIESPNQMPYIPLEYEHIALTLTKALKQEQCDERIKLYLMVLDEILPENEKSKDTFKQIKIVRNFVSHHKCDRKDVLMFVKEGLPNSIKVINGKEVVKYLRHVPDHIAFVCKYEEIARSLAFKTFRDVIKKLNGSFQ